MGRLGRLVHRLEWGPFGAGAYYLHRVWFDKMVRFSPPARWKRAMRRDQLVVATFALATLAALVLILSALAQGKGAIISRGQLVEIGGGFLKHHLG